MIQTTSYEISEKLQSYLEQAGYQTNVSFSIHMSGTLLNHHKGYRKGIDKRIKSLIPAFTMCELWEMLPNTIRKEDVFFELTITYLHPVWWVHYQSGNNIDYDSDNHCCTSVISGLANCVLWCIENNHKLNLPKNV